MANYLDQLKPLDWNNYTTPNPYQTQVTSPLQEPAFNFNNYNALNPWATEVGQSNWMNNGVVSNDAIGDFANQLTGYNSNVNTGVNLNLGAGANNQGFWGGLGDSISTGLKNTSALDWAKGIGGLAQSVGSIYMGNKQMGMAKDQMATANRQWQDQWNAQRKLANNQIGDAYEARVKGGGAASRANSESTEDYVKRKGI